MFKRPRLHWLALLRIVIVLLIVFISATVYVSWHPAVLRELLLQIPGVGFVEMPDLGPTPLAVAIDAAQGLPPAGQLALWGNTRVGPFGCGFLMRLEDGRRVGISTAHSTIPQPPNAPGQFNSPQGAFVVNLGGQIGFGSPFAHEHFITDYVLWSLQGTAPEEDFLMPDPRGAAQIGERVWLFDMTSGPKGAGARGGVVMLVKPEAIWVRFDDGFDPRGSSGCPVVSQHTGKVIGMVVAGNNLPPVVMGLNPIGAIVQKAEAALAPP